MPSLNLNNMSDKAYVVVNFGKNPSDPSKLEVELAVTSWISEDADGTFCYFPENLTTKKIDDLIKRQVKPKKEWNKFQCKIVCYAENFEQGKRRLKKSFTTNEPETSENDKQEKDSSEVVVEKRIAEKLISTTIPIINNTSESRESSRSPTPARRCSYSSRSRSISSSSDNSDRSTKRGGNHHDIIEHVDKKFEKVTDILKQMQDDLMAMKVDLQKNIDSVKRSIQYDISTKTESVKALVAETSNVTGQKNIVTLMNSFEPLKFPVETLESFNELNNMLIENVDKKKDMVQIMQYMSMGHSQVSRCANSALSKIINRDVQMLFSGTGKKMKNQTEKLNFSSTQLYLCFESAMLTKFGLSEEGSKIKSKVGVWLSGASDRDGGRKNRINKE